MQNRMFVLVIGLAFFCADVSGVLAAEIEIPVPSRSETAGAVINQQLQTKNQQSAEASSNNVEIKKDYQPAMAQDQGMKITVSQIKFIGDILIAEQKLQTVAAPYLNKEISFADLNQLCNDINQVLQANDYAVATAYLPQQDIVDGLLTIDIVGGRYGNINVKNDSGVNDKIIKMEMVGIKSDDFVRTSVLERAVLLLNDLSGVSAKAVLSAGSKIGTSDLNVDIKKYGKRFTWQLSYDNYGSYNIGPDEVGIIAYGSNVFGNGDNLYLRVNNGGIGSVSLDSNKGLLLGAFNWQTPIGADGGKIGISYSQVNYTLGRGFSGLNYTGQANVTSINWTKPLLRSRMSNLSISLGFDNAQLINGYPDLIGKANQTVNRLNLGLNADSMDSSGINVFNFTWTNGNATMDSMASQIFSDNISHTSGQYNKFSYVATRQQRLADRLALILKISGQFADKNLVSFEDISLGGPNGVRAYGVGEGSGDEGYLGTAELRWLLPNSENLQMIAFYDMGSVVINKNTWPAFQGVNSINLVGYGIGFIWNRPELYSINVAYAWRSGSQPSTIGDYPQTNGRFWISATINI